MTICAVAKHQVRQKLKTSIMRMTLFEATDERVFRRYQPEYEECQFKMFTTKIWTCITFVNTWLLETQKHELLLLNNPPYSLDLLPPNFFLLLQLKSVLENKLWAPRKSLQKWGEYWQWYRKYGFQEYFQKLHKCWKKCVTVQGNYYEGNVG
jgi:hypothetical protein